MKLKHVGVLLAAAITAMAAATAYADVSASGELFLKLPQGARAAAMGESFTAISDDATATHWNPAGLGSAAFASSWASKDVPAELRPLRGFAIVKSHGGNGFGASDVWAITPKGLARYDGKDWSFSDMITTRTDQTLSKIVSAIFNTSNADEIAMRSRKIAEANSRMTYAAMDSFFVKLLAALPEDAKQKATISSFVDSLRISYDQALINWVKVDEANKQFASAMTDGKMNETEIDRITFPLERGRNRFLPEELIIPFSAGYGGEATTIAGRGEILFVGTTDGLYQFAAKRWLKAENDSAFTAPVNCIYPFSAFTLVGFSNGVAKYNNGQLTPVDGGSALPQGKVDAIGGTGIADIWLAIDNDLYHWNGTDWANWQEYTVVLDDTANRIAQKFSVYGSGDEIAQFQEKLNKLNEPQATTTIPTATDSTATDSTVTNATPPASFTITAGKVIKVPYLAALRGKVTSIYSRGVNNLWVGTNYGLLHFTGSSWEMPGYVSHTVVEGETRQSLIDQMPNVSPLTKEQYRQGFAEINALPDSTELAVGSTVKIYRNANAAPVNSINSYQGKLYVSTVEGLVQLDGTTWSRAGMQGFGNADMQGVVMVEDEPWFASSSKIVTRTDSHSEIALGGQQLLPGLGIQDVYTTFFSFVTPVEGWGGVGTNITYLSLGGSEQRDENNVLISEFNSFEMAASIATGLAISSKVKGGIAVKGIYSHLSPVGAGKEQGNGTSTGVAFDCGILASLAEKLSFGAALTNLGPDIAYVDAAQSDPLPRTLSLGLAYKLSSSQSLHILVSGQIDKELVALDDGFSKEFSQTSPRIGTEVMWNNLFAVRAGYKYDGEDPDNSIFTIGAGLVIANTLKFDFSYVPTGNAQKNTLIPSLIVMF